MGNKLDVLFIHPVVHRKGQILHVIMPVGLFSLASVLRKRGLNTKIIHVGVEEILDQDFSLAETLRNYEPELVCISLNWYVHIYEALQIVKLAKECCGSFTVLGGFTASFFDNDILQSFNYVDVVVRGDGEIPLLKLVKEYYSSKDYKNVPNITYRNNGKITRNETGYVNYDMEDTSLIELELLNHWEVYLKINLWGKLDIPIYALFDPNARSSIDLVISRGCPYKCSYCGGGNEAQSILFGRNKFVFKDTDRLVDDCKGLKKQGVEEIRVEYVPYSQADKYYIGWFRKLQKAGLDFACRFSFWKPPSPEFINEMRETFNPVTIVMSPDSGSERIRKKYKECFYTNKQLYDTLEYIKGKNIDALLYFMAGFPDETKADYNMTLELAKDLLNKELINKATCFALNVEPASPLHLNPEKFNIKLFRKSLEDFYNWGKEVASGEKLQHYLGFERDDMSEKQILDLAKDFNSELNRI